MQGRNVRKHVFSGQSLVQRSRKHLFPAKAGRLEPRRGNLARVAWRGVRARGAAAPTRQVLLSGLHAGLGLAQPWSLLQGTR